MKTDLRSRINRQYGLAWTFFRKRLMIPFFALLAGSIAVTVISMYVFSAHPDAAGQLMRSFGEKAEGFTSSDGNIIMPLLLLNNLYASGIAAFSGFVPFIFLPVFSLLSNAFIIGAAFSVTSSYGYSSWMMLAAGILPHGVFEITALVLSLSAGVYLCYTVSRVIVNRRLRRKSGRIIEYAVNGAVRCYICYVVPLMCLAALIESFVTPQLIKSVM